MYLRDIITRYTNELGWFDYTKFNNWLRKKGFSIKTLERHNRTDGEVHFRYLHKNSGNIFDFNGNYWNADTFVKVIDWVCEIITN